MSDNKDCAVYLDKLDAWLAGELDAEHMWTHHDSCPACQQETRLAREIGSIAAALPELVCPDFRLPVRHEAPAQPFIARLLGTWRQPLVFVPAFAAVLAALVMIQLRTPDTAINPALVIIDGQEYTREEIQQAATDLELALRYIDKYSTYPAKVISAELESSGLPLPPLQNDPSI
jgi:hypothetical protein